VGDVLLFPLLNIKLDRKYDPILEFAVWNILMEYELLKLVKLDIVESMKF